MKKSVLLSLTLLLFVVAGAKAQKYNWDFNSGLEKWTVINYTNEEVTNGILTLTGAQTYCYIKYDFATADFMDAATYKYAVIKLRNETYDTEAKFFWRYNNAWVFVPFTISKEDKDFKEYVIDLSANDKWSGKIPIIRFDVPSPIHNESINNTISIDYIKFLDKKP
jgi:hypothetical protein